jgi:hypothetical protein
MKTAKKKLKNLVKIIKCNMYIDIYFIMEQPHDESTAMDIEQSQQQMMFDDEEYARQLQQEFLQEALLERQHEEERIKEMRRLENEENARIRLQQDMEYLECLNVIPKNNRSIENSEGVIIPPLPVSSIIEPTSEQDIIKPPEHFICPLSNKIMDIPIRDNEDNICYDKKTLLQYLKENNNKNHNGKTIHKQNLITDNILKTEIFLWLRQHPDYKE